MVEVHEATDVRSSGRILRLSLSVVSERIHAPSARLHDIESTRRRPDAFVEERARGPSLHACHLRMTMFPFSAIGPLLGGKERTEAHAKSHPDDVSLSRRIHRRSEPRNRLAPCRRRAQPGGDLSLGGADIVASFMKHDLIDEYRIYVHPVLIGRGKPLFAASDTRTNLRLVESRPFGNGVVLMRHRRANAK